LLRQPVDHRADLFAYGVTAYELLTGRKPFAGESPGEILRKQLDRTDYIAPRDLNPDIPFPLEKLIVKCLDREPEKRYPVTSLLVHELQSALYV
jgi:serine/threonine-protein kinase